ncbi:MAG: hypothetical protein IT166_06100 [Bryobacterales bacterium]|nr:hypothetical protein [Bryobacterales bacterium]
MATARDAAGWYSLIWPYDRNVGPAVVKIGNDGRLPGRMRCWTRGAAASSFHRIAVQDGYLFLGSVRGEIFVFKP